MKAAKSSWIPKTDRQVGAFLTSVSPPFLCLHSHHRHSLHIIAVALLCLSSQWAAAIQSSAEWALPGPERASQHHNWVLFSLCRLPVKFQINLNPLLTSKASLQRVVFLPSLVRGGGSPTSLEWLSSWQGLHAPHLSARVVSFQTSKLWVAVHLGSGEACPGHLHCSNTHLCPMDP